MDWQETPHVDQHIVYQTSPAPMDYNSILTHVHISTQIKHLELVSHLLEIVTLLQIVNDPPDWKCIPTKLDFVQPNAEMGQK